MKIVKKLGKRNVRALAVVGAAATSVLSSYAAQGATLIFTPGSVNGVRAGSWESSVAWTAGGTGVGVAWPGAGNFASTNSGYTQAFITLSTAQTADGIIYSNTEANNSVLTGTGSLTLSGVATVTTTTGTSFPFLNVALGGSNGLNVTGSGSLWLGGANTYTGNTTYVVTSGSSQLVIGNSAALQGNLSVGVTTSSYGKVFFAGNSNVGTASTTINFTGSARQNFGNYSGNNTFNGTINLAPAAANTVITPLIQSGTLTLTANNALGIAVGGNAGWLATGALGDTNGTTAGFTLGTLKFTGNNNNFTGTASVVSQGLTISGASGSLAASTFNVHNSGQLTIDSTTGVNLTPVASTAVIAIDSGGVFNDLGNATTSSNQTAGRINIGTGEAFINMTAGASAGNALTLTSGINPSGSTPALYITAKNLGTAAPGVGITNLIGTTSGYGALRGGGGGAVGASQNASIYPWMVVVDSGNTGLEKGSFGADGANGYTALRASDYDTNFTAVVGTTTNERVTSAQTLTAGQVVNGLLLDSAGSINQGGNSLKVGFPGGSTHAAAGILALGSANTISGGTLTFASNATMFFNTVGNLTVSSNIAGGTSGLVKTGNGTLNLNASNAFSSASEVAGGILLASADGALGTGNFVVQPNATLEIGGGVNYSSASGTINLNAANHRTIFGFNPTNPNVSYYYAGPLNPNLGGFYGDSSNNTFAGNVIGTASGYQPTIGVAAGGTLTLSNFNTAVANNKGLVKLGDGKLVITSAMSQGSGNATVYIDAGTVAYAGAESNATTGTWTHNVNPGTTLLLDNTATANYTNRLGTGSSTVTLNSGTLQINANASTPGTQTINTVGYATGFNTVSAQAGAGSVTLQMNAFTQTTNSSVLVEGTNLGSAAPGTAGVANIKTNTVQTLYGANTTPTTTPIARFIIGDTTGTGGGNTFVTYDATNGFKPLPLTAYENGLATSSTDLTAPENVIVTASDAGTNNKINSLVIANNTGSVMTIGGATYNANNTKIFNSSGSLTATGSNYNQGLIISSGANDTIVNSQLGGSISEAVWVTGTGTLTFAATSSSFSSPLVKSGPGTLILTDNNSGITSINVQAGKLLAMAGGNAGTAGPTGGNPSGNVTVLGGATFGGDGSIVNQLVTTSIGAQPSTVVLPYTYAGAIAPGVQNNPLPYKAGTIGGSTAGTLTVVNNVVLGNGSFLDYVLNAPNVAAGTGGNSYLNILGQTTNGNKSGTNLNAGVLTMGINEALVITADSGFGAGNYHLIGVNGAFNDLSQGFLNWQVIGPAGFTYAFSLVPVTANQGYVDLNVTSTGALPPMWTNGAGGFSWNTAGNWQPSGVLNAQAAVANFTSVGAGAVTLDGSKTVGKINISGGTAYTFNQGSGGTLTIDDTGDAVVAPQINLTGGQTHTFNVPINLTAGVSVNMSNSTNVTFNNSFTGTGPMTIAGSGTATIGTSGQLNPTSSLSLTTGAHLVLAAVAAPSTPNAQTVASLSNDGSALLDIKNNKVTVTTATPAAIQGQIATAFAAGLWTGSTGITSTTAQADLHHGIGFADNGAGGVVMRYTLYGDTDLSGSINFSDLVTLAQHYNSTTATWATGDFNYDNTVNFGDLVALAQNYNGVLTPGQDSSLSPSFAADWSLAQAEVAAVPEPTSIGLLAVGATGLLARRRRRVAK